MSGSDRDPSDAVWQHDLRNAVNATVLAIAAGKHLLAQGQHARAQETLDRADLALRRVVVLLDQPPVASDGVTRDNVPD